MYSLTASILIIGIFCSLILSTKQQYTPDWTSLDKRELPTWYDESKVGIFIHWGVFSVPSVYSEWYVFIWSVFSFYALVWITEKISLFVYRMWWAWKGTNPNPDTVAFMNKNYPADWTYADFAPQFRAELYGL